jgi:hypothetical protein
MICRAVFSTCTSSVDDVVVIAFRECWDTCMSAIPGELAKDRFGPVVPVHAPAYNIAPTMHFTDVDILTFTYRTDPGVIPSAVDGRPRRSPNWCPPP